ncbi:AAA family ATPase [Labrys okinawensis]|uniref:AAA family ATPase n=1 Tax=Labrys okinawensis TaxID=346911 RepID=UPI0039BCFA8E
MFSSALGERRSKAKVASILPMVGRDQELALLVERWRQSAAGLGQCVVITGEGGIGKSRLISALREALDAYTPLMVRWQCSPYHVDSALWPAIRQLNLAAGLAAADSNFERLEKLEALLRRGRNDIVESVWLIADLLGIESAPRYPALGLSGQQQRDRTLNLLADQLTSLAKQGSVLFIVEDVHWADPTSLELLRLIIGRVQDASALVVITARPEFNDRFGSAPHLSRFTLNRLGHRATQAIAAQVTGALLLPTGLLDLIAARTDGMPLYIEELTKAIIESGALQELADSQSAAVIPASLESSLLVRLDRLGPAKIVAQTAACIGRGFERSILLAISDLAAVEVDKALERLIASELVFPTDTPGEVVYRFKHALVRDAAYDSLPNTARRTLHARIAEYLESGIPDVAQIQPELLAHHFAQGGLVERAIPYWQRAGERSARASADAEAIAHLKKGLALLESLPENRVRMKQALDMYLVMGSAVSNIRGSGGREVGRIYHQARQLCERVGDAEDLFAALFGLWAHYHMSAHLQEAQRAADDVVELATQLPDSGFQLQAHHAAWTACHAIGDLSHALHHAEQGLRLYDIDRHRSHAFIYAGHDPGVCAGLHAAELKWQLGFPDQALRYARDLLDLGERLSHPVSLATAQSVIVLIRALRGEWQTALGLAEEMLAFTTEQNIEIWRTNARMLRDWVATALGRGSEVIEDFQAAVEQRATRGALLRQSFYQALLAESYGAIGQVDQGLATVNKALAQIEASGERCWESLVRRVRASLLVRSGAKPQEVERAFVRALEVAQAQHATSLELQAALGIARYWQAQGRTEDAVGLMAPIVSSFREGFETRDVVEARSLLSAGSQS